MGVEATAILFWGVDRAPSFDLDAFEARLAEHGCAVVFYGDFVGLAVRDSIVRRHMWSAGDEGELPPSGPTLDPGWTARLLACCAMLGIEARAPGWYVALAVC